MPACHGFSVTVCAHKNHSRTHTFTSICEVEAEHNWLLFMTLFYTFFLKFSLFVASKLLLGISVGVHFTKKVRFMSILF